MNCDFTLKDGSPCTEPAAHYWGTVKMCCQHFDGFVWGNIVPTKERQIPPRHIDIVEEYNERTERDSILPGADCEAKKNPPGET